MMTLKSLNGLNQIRLNNEFLMRGVLCVVINVNIIVGIMTTVRNGNVKLTIGHYVHFSNSVNKQTT